MSMWIQYKKANTVNKQHHTNEYDKQLTIMSDNDDDDDESNTVIINNETVSNKHGKLQ